MAWPKEDWFEATFKRDPTKPALTFVDDRGIETASLSYGELDKQSFALACALLDGLPGVPALVPGDRALLVYLPSLDFLVSFLACLRSGIVAVPVYPPDLRSGRSNFVAFSSIARDCGAKVVLTHLAYYQLMSLAALRDTAVRLLRVFSSGDYVAPAWPDLPWATTDNLGSRSTSKRGRPLGSFEADAVAFLQYTSGSTGDPKGVMVTYGCLRHNLAAIAAAQNSTDTDVGCSWLPQYHDMGLVGGCMHTLFVGAHTVLLSPLSFLKRPVLWVELMSRYRATQTGAPNFALKLTARKWAEEAENRSLRGDAPVDLSPLRRIFNAAEPITVDAMQEFVRAFAPCGLDPKALNLGYGLAETTLYVCDRGSTVLRIDASAYEAQGRIVVESASSVTTALCDARSATSPTLKELASCGVVAAGSTAGAAALNLSADIIVAIVDPETCRPAPVDSVGEVWVSSPSVTRGYWGKAELTSGTFGARIVGAPESLAALPFLRTGDLGFLYDGELFISGRMSDIIALRGRNYFPQDVEQAIAAVRGVRPGCIAAFQAPVTVGTSEEDLVAVAEVRDVNLSTPALAELASAICASVMQYNALSLGAVVLLRPQAAIKTTSGKIARARNRRAFVALQSNDALSCPWLRHASGSPASLVLLSWRPPARAATDLSIPDFDSAVSGDALSLFTGLPSSPRDAGPASPATRSTSPRLEGAALHDALRFEVAALLRTDPEAVSPDHALLDLGLDSVALAKLTGALANKYGIRVREEVLYAHQASIAWLVAHAGALRRGETPALPPSPCATASSGIATPPHLSLRTRSARAASTTTGGTTGGRDCETDPEADSRSDAFIAAFATATPPLVPARHAAAVFGDGMRSAGASADATASFVRMCKGTGIRTRGIALAKYHIGTDREGQECLGKRAGVPLPDELLDAGAHTLSLEQRAALWDYFAPRLCLEAARKALGAWTGHVAADITHVLTTNTSGWREPGLSCHLIHELGLSLDTQKADLNFNGCFCGMTCLRLARDIVRSGDRRAVLVVGVEVASLQSDEAAQDPQSLVAYSLFADGAGAFIVASEGSWRFSDAGMSVIAGSGHLLGMQPHAAPQAGLARPPRQSFQMTLSPAVPAALGAYFMCGNPGAAVLERVLAGGPAADTALAVHPGGPRILEALSSRLSQGVGLPADALAESYETLHEYGNLGSTAILFVLARVFSSTAKGHVAALAFGPGVTVEWGAFQRVQQQSQARPGGVRVAPTERDLAAWAADLTARESALEARLAELEGPPAPGRRSLWQRRMPCPTVFHPMMLLPLSATLVAAAAVIMVVFFGIF